MIRELVPNPVQAQGIKRSLEIHLQDIMSTCSLKDFYKVLDVFQRNNFCNVTGMLLEVKDYDIASSFLLSHSLHPTNSSKGASNAINADDKDDGESEKEDEASSKLCRYIIKFSVFQPPHGSKSVY